MTTTESAAAAAKRSVRLPAAIGLGLFSLLYFLDAILRARMKLMWCDEIFTYYMCRLPDMKRIWAAETHGADGNAPLFYLITRASERIFSDGLIGIRVPEIVGFWILCICLYVFVSKRAGVLAGMVAAIFPVLTGANFYIQEARPYGLLFACGGIALIAWQNAADRRNRRLWIPVFAASLTCAMLLHFSAAFMMVPFGIAELFRLWERRRIDWATWGSLIVAALIGLIVNVPIFRGIRDSMPPTFFPASPLAIQRFYITLITPVLLLLLAVLGLFCWDRSTGARTPAGLSIPKRELALALSFLGLPFIGFVVMWLVRSPLVDRYLLTTVFGFAILIGLACAVSSRRWISTAVATCVILLFVWTSYRTLGWQIHHVEEHVLEPSSGWPLNNTGNPTAHYSLLLNAPKDMEILVGSGVDYIYLRHYMPAEIADRIWYCPEDPNDATLALFRQFKAWVVPAMRVGVYDDFAAVHPRFLVYDGTGLDADQMFQIMDDGSTIRGSQNEDNQFLYEVTR